MSNPIENRHSLTKILLFLISPLLGLIAALKNINTRSSFVVFFLFALTFGFSLETSIGKDDVHRGDAAAYRARFEIQKYYTQNDLSNVFDEYQSFENEKERELYIPIMSYITAKVSDNYHVFFMLLACVFSLFMLKSLKFLVAEEAFTQSFACLLLLFLFIRSNGIFNINGARFWTASWIAIYSLFQVLRNDNKRYLVLLAVTPMIHASYWFLLAIVGIYYIAGKFKHFWKLAFFVSFILAIFAMQLIIDLSNYLPPTLQFLVNRYTDDDIEIKTNLYQLIRRFFNTAYSIYIVYIMYLFMKHDDCIEKNSKTRNIYRFMLVMMSIVNFVMLIPSLGSRYYIVCMPFIAYLWLVTFESSHQYRNVLKWLPVISIMLLYERYMDYTAHSVSISFYYSSPLYLVYKYLIIGVA